MIKYLKKIRIKVKYLFVGRIFVIKGVNVKFLKQDFVSKEGVQ